MCNTTRYFGGYMAKVPTVGRTVRDMAESACQALRMKMEGVEPWRNVRKAVFRCISDWEGKGSTRTIYEEMNLAIHADAASPLAAECIVTTPYVNFYGSFFVHAVESSVKVHAGKQLKRVKGSLGVNATTGRASALGSTQAKAYGNRPLSDELAHLSPWEFVRDWEVAHTSPPSPKDNAVKGYTRWWSIDAKDQVSLGVKPIPGVHYEIAMPSEGEDYVVFPEMEDDSHFRHLWVLVPRHAPHVPVFKLRERWMQKGAACEA
jgi:hypothetical protein